MALLPVPAVTLAAWNEYQYELRHRNSDFMRMMADIADRSADDCERERIDCVSKAGRKPYEPRARDEQLRQRYEGCIRTNFNFDDWAAEATWHERKRDEHRESAKKHAEEFEKYREKRPLSFLFSRI